jgi:eukaryotic-like serine/threonine-protein kinase
MPEKWDQIRDLFASALERRPEERNDFLRETCGHDLALRNEIESLLSSYEGADSFLEYGPTADLISHHSGPIAGRKIGAYRIIGECGQGGMAVVYLAERADDQYRKRVAIKMVRPGTNTDEILRRFRNERQALASLDHANIVRLLDGGSTEDGIPYLVMDYVEGVRIDEYCDAHRLPIGERLQLFRIVCGAVQFAHNNLVIHRDLKPGNILITADGVPRLLDFGIAKVLNPKLMQNTMLTRTKCHPMTPEYASPEQVRGEPVTRATDVYSLGVLLYELLTGHRPYGVGAASSLELDRLICDEKPQKPSMVIRRTDHPGPGDGNTGLVLTPRRVAELRGTRPEQLRRCLSGDLDTIVLKAIRKEPQHRYNSAEEFSDDITRHLSSKPIRARNPTLTYRTGKFLQRHKESVGAALLVIVIMAGSSWWQGRRLGKQKNTSVPTSGLNIRVRPSVAILGFKNLSVAPETAWISTAFSEMLSTELAAGEELRIVPAETVARIRVDLGVSNVESLNPDTLAKLQQNLGSDFLIFGSYFVDQEPGGRIRLDLRLQDMAKRETVAAASDSATEATMTELVARVSARLRQQFGLGQLSEVESAAMQTAMPSQLTLMRLYYEGLTKLRSFDALTARDLLVRAVAADPSFVLAHSALAQAWLTLGYDLNARQEAKRALDGAGSLSREKHLLVEARFYEADKDWDKATEACQTLLSFFPDNLDYGLQLANDQTAGGRGKDALNTLAALASSIPHAQSDPRIDVARSEAAAALGDNQLRRDAAERAAKEADKQGAKLLAARARGSECRALANLGENEKAEASCEEARQIYTGAGDQGALAQTLHSMAEVPINQGDFSTAEKLYRQALTATRAIGDQKGQARELINLGLIFDKKADFSTALQMYKESFQKYQQAGDKIGMAGVLGNTGNLFMAEGRLGDALTNYKETLALSNQVGHRGSAAEALAAIGNVLAEQGDLTAAYEKYQQASAIQHDVGEKTAYADTLLQIGRMFRQQAKADQARQSYVEALSIQEQLGDKSDAAETRLALAELACDSGKGTEAEQLSRAALEVFRTNAYTVQEISAQTLLSRSLLQQGQIDAARAVAAEAVRQSQKTQAASVQIPVLLDRACVMSAGKDFTEGAAAAHEALTRAQKLGLFRLQLEALLTLGQIELAGKNQIAGRARLKAIAENAHAKGFELIARKAADVERGASTF